MVRRKRPKPRRNFVEGIILCRICPRFSAEAIVRFPVRIRGLIRGLVVRRVDLAQPVAPIKGNKREIPLPRGIFH